VTVNETADITSPLIDSINAIPGCVARRQHAGRVKVRGGWMHLGAEGWPDILAIVRGRVLMIETKVPGGQPSPAQIACHARLRACGAQVEICRSVPGGMAIVRLAMREAWTDYKGACRQ
jgi:hypothetical protein